MLDGWQSFHFPCFVQPVTFAAMNGAVTRRLKFLGVVAGVVLAWPASAQVPARSLYAGESLVFEHAQLIKPFEETNTAVAYALAPLLIQEVKGTNASSPRPREVFFQFGSARLNGQDRVQVLYWWRRGDGEVSAATGRSIFYPPRAAFMFESVTPKRARPINLEPSVRWQGLRLTLDDSGRPVIYEVLAAPAVLAQIYVAQSVEAAARTVFGAVLPGRRFAVEPSLETVPRVVVPRVVEDAPAVMGPILYLRAENREVATLICRCMASQALQLVDTGYYRLIRANPPTAIAVLTGSLEVSLRLPRAFSLGNTAAP